MSEPRNAGVGVYVARERAIEHIAVIAYPLVWRESKPGMASLDRGREVWSRKSRLVRYALADRVLMRVCADSETPKRSCLAQKNKRCVLHLAL